MPSSRGTSRPRNQICVSCAADGFFTPEPSGKSKITLRLTWERICLQCGRPRFNPWVGKIPYRREQQPTPICLPEQSHGQRSLVGLQSMGCQRVRHNWLTSTFTLRNNRDFRTMLSGSQKLYKGTAFEM